jgi:GntR family transcriptional regulator, transcriptional repressor for pyruvate dehydrogenase complex
MSQVLGAGTGERVPKGSDVVARRLRAQIIGGDMEPGAELPSEAEIMQRYGFSRSVVREALRLLEADGLITTKRGPGGGIRVRRPDERRVGHALAVLFASQKLTHRNFLDFQLLVQPHVAGLAALNATDEQRERIVQLADDEVCHHMGVGDSVRFHRALSESCGNNLIHTVIVALERALGDHKLAEVLAPAEVEDNTQGHVKIAKAVAAGKQVAAERAMRDHLLAFTERPAVKARLDTPVIPPSGWDNGLLNAY